MKGKFIVVAALAIAALALAQHTVRVVGAVGRGVASNHDGRHGHFSLEVKKAVRGDRVELGGRFEWREVTTSNTGGFTVVMVRPTGIEVNNTHDVCEFTGPAKMTRMTPSGPVTHEGRLIARVVDRRRPDAGGTSGGGDSVDGVNPPDLIRWQFISPATSVTHGFEGFVREGDIKVFARMLTGSTTGGTTGGTSGGGRGG